MDQIRENNSIANVVNGGNRLYYCTLYAGSNAKLQFYGCLQCFFVYYEKQNRYRTFAMIKNWTSKKMEAISL